MTREPAGMLERKKAQLLRDKKQLEEELLTRVLTVQEIRSKKHLLESLNRRLVEIDRLIWPNKLW